MPRFVAIPPQVLSAFGLPVMLGLAVFLSCTFPDFQVPKQAPQPTPSCPGGEGCEEPCTAGFTDCNGLPDDGCETPPGTDCEEPCAPGLADCNGLPEDGCETQLGTASDCAACGAACTNEHGLNECVVNPAPASATCQPTCATGFEDCDLKPDNGCETNTSSDSLNCSACGRACPANGGTPNCVAGVCGVASCNAGFGDCNNVGVCSFNLTNDPDNCGGCGRVCPRDHGTPRCNAGVCEIDCEPGWGDCNAADSAAPSDGCETKLNVPDEDGHVDNCGACGARCGRRAFTTINLEKCEQGICFRDCFEGAYDCDDQRNDPSCNGSGCGCDFTACE